MQQNLQYLPFYSKYASFLLKLDTPINSTAACSYEDVGATLIVAKIASSFKQRWVATEIWQTHFFLTPHQKSFFQFQTCSRQPQQMPVKDNFLSVTGMNYATDWSLLTDRQMNLHFACFFYEMCGSLLLALSTYRLCLSLSISYEFSCFNSVLLISCCG